MKPQHLVTDTWFIINTYEKLEVNLNCFEISNL